MLAAFTLAAPVALASPAAATDTPTCSRYAAPGGSDAGAGDRTAPFATVQRLLDALAPGQTGCLEAGTYSGDVRVNKGGTPERPLTLTSVPGARATVRGRLYVAAGSDDVTISGLRLDGTNAKLLPSPQLNAARTVLADNDITNNHTGICVELGTRGWGRAVDVTISGNRIHDCGVLPVTNLHHGIYVNWSLRAQIVGNWIYDNADRGIQLYQDAQETTIAGNVIDGNGEGVIFSGGDGYASSDNRVTGNVISNSRVRYAVESWWPAGNPIGTGNVATENCLWGGARSEPIGEQIGFRAADNTIAQPAFVDRAAGDLTLVPGTPCAEILAGARPAGAATGTASDPGAAPLPGDAATIPTTGGADTPSAAPAGTASKPTAKPKSKKAARCKRARAKSNGTKRARRARSCKRARASSTAAKRRARTPASSGTER